MDWGRERAFLENGPSLPQTCQRGLREGRTTEIPLDAGEKIKSIGISVLAFSRRRALAEKPMGKKDGRRRIACFVF